MASRIYLDHAATTPLLPEALAAMAEGWATWANPSSPHADGRAAKAVLEEARRRVARALDWEGTVVFTSGATEAIDIAFARAKVQGRMMSAVEHPAVLRHEAKVVGVGPDGLIDVGALAARALVAVQAVNNETGVIQPLADVASRVRSAGGLLLADCAQSARKLPLPDADFIAISAHKIGGPPGVGALLVRDKAALAAIGGQEGGHRAGTVPVPLILGLAAALEGDREWLSEAARLRTLLEEEIVAAGGEVIARDTLRTATIGACRMPGVPAAAQLMQFDLAGISVSAGSACSSGSLKPSHVLAAMGLSENAARETIRVSFGRSTTEAEVRTFLAEWRRLLERRRAA